ncbi:DUF4225 domain-containing protein [Pseudomonas sp. TH39(2020)]|uniref:DUF4225 domain-containing protein n=1 Tax=Pseudomonas sp. TH39(2020) TaxID=2796349 RepID=UPI001913C3B2|nr:DUF4225 domain-containing protein [Pseudomonas sp. TH39(2020)]
MNEDSCDLHDVTKAASDLVAVGCSIGTTHFPDGLTRLRFGSIISSYANEVIQAVDEGLISAWEGVEEIRAEYEGLSSKARFYLQNGIGVAAGVMQVRAGVTVAGTPGMFGVVPGVLLVAHGTNNIYEGLSNIYYGPDVPSTLGPVRRGYQVMLRDDYRGNMIYYSLDLFLSGYGVLRSVPKSGMFELFRRDYERAYQQSGRLALTLEAFVDFFTVNAIAQENSGFYDGVAKP